MVRSVPCILLLCLAAANALYAGGRSNHGGSSQRFGREMVVQVARLSEFDGARLPHKYSKHPNEDVGWERIVGTNAEHGDITSFRAYESEHGDFETEMHVCRTRTKTPEGRRTDTWILRPGELGPCSRLGDGWQREFSFFVAEDRETNTQEIHFATCKRSSGGNTKTLYTRISTEDIDCGPDHRYKTGSFYAVVGPMACEPVINPPHTYRGDSRSHGGILRSLTLKCQSGYRSNGPEEMNCIEGEWDAPPPTCIAITCPAPPSVPHGRPSRIGPYEYMAEVTYECTDGYELHPTYERIQCRETGEWTQSIAQCRPVDCGFPGDIENGDLSQGPYSFGGEVQFSCDSGYALYGASSATCLETGRWSERNPKKKKVPTATLR